MKIYFTLKVIIRYSKFLTLSLSSCSFDNFLPDLYGKLLQQLVGITEKYKYLLYPLVPVNMPKWKIFQISIKSVKVFIILCYLFYIDYKLTVLNIYIYAQSKSSLFPGKENNLNRAKKYVREITFTQKGSKEKRVNIIVSRNTQSIRKRRKIVYLSHSSVP